MTTAFVLGGGGVLGATQVGMMRGLIEAGITPDLVVGTSIGAVNGAFVAQDPSLEAVDTLGRLWTDVIRSGGLNDSPVRRAARLAKHHTHLMSPGVIPRLVDRYLGTALIEDLQIPFQCVAAEIETSSSHWFTAGPVAQAVAASCAVPGLFAPVEVDGRHYFDGGLVHSIPVGRAMALGAREVYVLQVGRVEQPLSAPTTPLEVGMVAFEIARRHRYVEEIASVPEDIALHVLPSGSSNNPAMTAIGRPDPERVNRRIEAGYEATRGYLDGLESA